VTALRKRRPVTSDEIRRLRLEKVNRVIVMKNFLLEWGRFRHCNGIVARSMNGVTALKLNTTNLIEQAGQDCWRGVPVGFDVVLTID
jgi:hypothetical protein